MLQRLNKHNKVGDVPVAVAAVAIIGGWFAIRGTGNVLGVPGVPGYLDPVYYAQTLFVHSGLSHYVSVMYFFVPAGMVLTYLTNNRKVASVVVLSHLPTAAACSVLGVGKVGAGAAAYGLIAAVLIRAAWLSAEEYSRNAQVASSVGAFVLTGLGLVALTGPDAAAYAVPVFGFIFGGAYDAARSLGEFRGSETDGRGSSMGQGGSTSFGGPFSKKGDERSGGGAAAPDDTHAGSGGRTRKE